MQDLQIGWKKTNLQANCYGWIFAISYKEFLIICAGVTPIIQIGYEAVVNPS